MDACPASPAISQQVLSLLILRPQDKISQSSTELTIIRNRIRSRPQTVEVISPLIIRNKFAPQIKLDLVRILLFIQPIRRSLPHLNGGSDNRFLGLEIHHATMHKHHLAVLHASDYIIPILAVGSVRAEERTQNSCCSGRVFCFVR